MPRAGAAPSRTRAPAKARSAVSTRTTAGSTHSGSQAPTLREAIPEQSGHFQFTTGGAAPLFRIRHKESTCFRDKTKDQCPDKPQQPGRLLDPVPCLCRSAKLGRPFPPRPLPPREPHSDSMTRAVGSSWSGVRAGGSSAPSLRPAHPPPLGPFGPLYLGRSALPGAT